MPVAFSALASQGKWRKTYEIHCSPFKSRHGQSEDCCIDEAPDSKPQIDQILGTIAVDADIRQDRSQEISMNSD